MSLSAARLLRPQEKPRRISILGATGSIGTTTLSIVRQHPRQFTIEALTGNSNVQLLIEQALEFRPRYAAIANEDKYPLLKEALAGTGIEVAAGETAIVEAAQRPCDWLMAGIVGIAGLKPTLAAIENGVTVALANKECLVSAGDIVQRACTRHNATLLPVDSEHNAIFQALGDNDLASVETITLTASGGPFLRLSKEELAQVTPKQALTHPNWKMGRKITVDSASLMNKGLEAIEAWHFFPIEKDRIRVVVHPESIIHSLVHYRDGSVLAQLSLPDMATPIAYTMQWPHRLSIETPRLDLAAIGALHFEAPDTDRFPCLKLAYGALHSGGAAPAMLNAANEEAVEAFLENRLRFNDIPALIEHVLSTLTLPPPATLEEVLETDRCARECARNWNN